MTNNNSVKIEKILWVIYISLLLTAITCIKAFSQLDITRKNITATENFHVRGDTTLNANEAAQMIEDSITNFHNTIKTSKNIEAEDSVITEEVFTSNLTAGTLTVEGGDIDFSDSYIIYGGENSFNGTDLTDTVSISASVPNDFFIVSPKSNNPIAADFITWEILNDALVVHRQTGTTNNLGYSWVRFRK